MNRAICARSRSKRAAQIPYVGHADIAAFNLNDNPFGAAAVVVKEIDYAVNAAVGAAAAVIPGWQALNQAQGPILELVAAVVFAFQGQGPRAGQIFGIADTA